MKAQVRSSSAVQYLLWGFRATSQFAELIYYDGDRELESQKTFKRFYKTVGCTNWRDSIDTYNTKQHTNCIVLILPFLWDLKSGRKQKKRNVCENAEKIGLVAIR